MVINPKSAAKPAKNPPDLSQRAAPSGGAIRTCIGCRQQALRSDLVRLVVARPSNNAILVDKRKREPGRGAWIHQSSKCFELAVRRRAFNRALRITDADWSAVKAYLQDVS